MQSVEQQAPESDGETPCPPAPSLELLVRNSAGGPSWPVVLPADATSCALHEAVEKASGHAVAQQRLIFQGRILPVDATPLRSLGVESGLVVHLALRPAAVAGAPPAAASAAGSAVELAALSRDGRARAALVEDGLTEGELAMLMRLQLDEADAAPRAADPGDVSDFCLGLLAGSLLGFIALLCAAEPAAPRRLRAGLLCGVILNATVFTRTRSHAQDSFFEDRR